MHQLNLPLQLLHVRWRILDPAQLLMLRRRCSSGRPARAGGGEAPALTQADRWALTMAAARSVADVAASSESSYRLCLDGLASLKITLLRPRGTAAPVSGSGRTGGRLATCSSDGGGGGGCGGGGGGRAEGEQCRPCWGVGHRRTNSACPQFGKSALPQAGERRPLRPQTRAARKRLLL